MSTKKKTLEVDKMIAAITERKNKIAAERDKLRTMISDVEDICLESDDAVDELTRAVESLSKYL